MSDTCLLCGGAQELVVGVRERGPHPQLHDYTRVLFCPACDVGELRAFSFDGFVAWDEEDPVMVWSAALSTADVSLLRTAFACPNPLDHRCGCAQHERAYSTSVGTTKTLLSEYGPRRHSPDGRSTATVRVAGGLAEFRSAAL
ncbi:hypothetical protein [Nocardia sp. NRRL S-836]|uniref:hypothetical protein n=1 Tax=Nocardia sp. NRRL S-836 TaxID=1519492 RepID=UPI0006AF198F|nr:hypothetical protein [Nocardia sp. NRRL S-836]KOV85200.1 hypothetical protein ADL03_13355 [Nocardia sp. NRRL S-836]